VRSLGFVRGKRGRIRAKSLLEQIRRQVLAFDGHDPIDALLALAHAVASNWRAVCTKVSVAPRPRSMHRARFPSSPLPWWVVPSVSFSFTTKYLIENVHGDRVADATGRHGYR
jgi:hypothetical protein